VRKLSSALLLLALATPAFAEDWPKYLGPRGDGISNEKIADTWPADGLKPVWSATVGVGYSSPVTANGKLYIVGLVDKKEILYCLDAATGKPVWKSSVGSAWTQGGMGYAGTRATPTIEGDFIYTYSGKGDLACRKIADGSVVWTINVIQDTGAKDLQWGEASSPAVIGNAIFVQGGLGGPICVAVDKTSGKYLWKSESGTPGYTTPVQINVDGADQLIVLGGKIAYAFNPADGKTIWTLPWETYADINAANPLYRDGKIFVTAAYAHGGMLIAAKKDSAAIAWFKKNSIQAKFPTPIMQDEFILGNSEGTLTAIAWPGGETLWKGKENLGAGGNLLLAGDKLVTLTERGKLSLSTVSKTGVTPIASFKAVDGGNVWSSPVISNGKLYVKGADELVCFDVSAK
jgi:outer membrane protein assembly factor BamB